MPHTLLGKINIIILWIKENRIKTAALAVTTFIILSYYGCTNSANWKHDFFRTMTIDSHTLQVTLSDPIPYDPGEPKGPYFWPFNYQSGYYVSHYDGKRIYPHRVRYNVFTVNPVNQLQESEKYQELVKGSFGTVYAHTEAFYRQDATAGDIDFEVLHDTGETEHEPPMIVRDTPSNVPHKLDAISLIRVFCSAEKYIVVIGNYTPDGKLVSFVKPSYVNIRDSSSGTADLASDYNLYGFPTQISVVKYMKKPYPLWKVIPLSNTLNIINFHYDRNKWVRQDNFVSTSEPKTRILTYVTTAQDTMLAPANQRMQYRVTGY